MTFPSTHTNTCTENPPTTTPPTYRQTHPNTNP